MHPKKKILLMADSSSLCLTIIVCIIAAKNNYQFLVPAIELAHSNIIYITSSKNFFNRLQLYNDKNTT